MNKYIRERAREREREREGEREYEEDNFLLESTLVMGIIRAHGDHVAGFDDF